MAASRASQALILLALVVVLGLAAWYGEEVRQDSGSFVLVLFGVPALCAVLASWAERSSRSMLAPAVIGALGLLALVWTLITGLGLGLLFLLPSLLLLGAAAASWGGRARSDARPVRT